MIRMRAAQRNSLLFHSITLSFLLILVIDLAPDGPISHADAPIGTVLSHERFLLVPAVVPPVCSLVVITLTRAIPATATQAQSSSGCGVILDKNEYILAIV